MAILVDTGVFLAIADASDADHDRCVRVYQGHRGELVAPAPVIPEASWLIETRLGPAAEATFLRLVTNREVRVVDLDLPAYERCIHLIETYADLGLGLVDASVVTVAENERVTTIATLNQRDFRVVRPSHCAAFELIP